LIGSILALRKLFNGSIDKSHIYRYFKARKLTIYSEDDDLIVHLDGEPHVFSGKLQVQLHHRVLKVALGATVKQQALAGDKGQIRDER
jgi:diacylglycerol kinase family enzyme